MRGPRPASCNFPEEFLQEAREAVKRRVVPWQSVQRFRLVLLLEEQPGISNEAAGQQIEMSSRQVQRWRQRWAAGDFSIDDASGRGRKATFSPSGSIIDPRNGM